MKKYTLSELQAITTDITREIARIAEEESLTYYAIYGTLLGTIRHKGPIPWDYDVDIYVPEKDIEFFVQTLEKKLPDKYWVNYRNAGGVPQKFPRVGLKGYETEELHVDIFRMAAIPNNEEEQRKLWKSGVFWSKIWKAKVIDPDYYYEDFKRRFSAKAVKVLFFPLSINTVATKMDEVCKRYTFGSTRYVGNPFFSGRKYPIEYFNNTVLMPYCDFMIRVPAEYDRILRETYGDYMKLPPEAERTQMATKEYIIREI